MPHSSAHAPSILNIPQSSLTWQLPNYPTQGKTTLGRFTLESRLQFISAEDTEPDANNDFWLLAPVMACRVFGDMPVMQQPPYEYWAIFGDEHYHVMRTGDTDQITDSTHRITDTFNWVHRHRVESPAQGLTTTAAIIQATLAHHTLMAQAKLPSPAHNGHWLLTFPVKHMNVSVDSGQFQCETGPILIPRRDAPLAHGTSTLAEVDTFFRTAVGVSYVAFNRLDRLESLIRTHHDDGTRRFRQRSMTHAEIAIWAIGL